MTLTITTGFSSLSSIEDNDDKNYEDVAVMHRIVDRASLVAVEPSVLYHYRIRSESITKTYTAKNLMDYADARLSRYNYFLDGKRFIQTRFECLAK